MKVLILGAKGMLGSDVVEAFQDQEVIAYGKDEFDITNPEHITKISSIKPDVIINAAAYTDVDGCEDNRELAFKVNAEAVKKLAEATKQNNCFFVHLSTDYVFDGSKKQGYREDDEKNPINVYGQSKAKGEDYIIEAMDDYCLIRSSWLFGKNGKNFVKAILKTANEKETIEVVDDQFGFPTYTKDLARKIRELVELHKRGIFHITNDKSCSWFEFARKIIQIKKLKNKIIPTKSSQLTRKAKRPHYSILLNTKTSKLRPWQNALEDYLNQKLP